MNFKSLPFINPLVFFLVSFLAFAGFPFGFSKSVVAEDANGSIVGVVFQNDVMTPVVGAEVKAINNETGEIYISYKTDKYGIYKIEVLPVGEYNIGLSTEEGDFISDIVVKVEPNTPTPAPLMVKQTQDVKKVNPKKKWYKRTVGMLILVGSGAALGYVIYKAVASPSEPGS